MGVSVIALIWVNNWPDQLAPAFRIAPMAPYFALVTILNGRVHRNTKLGLYNTASLQSNVPKSQPNVAAYIMLPVTQTTSSVHPATIPPIEVTHVDDSDASGYRNDCSTTRSRASIKSLDFGMV